MIKNNLLKKLFFTLFVATGALLLYIHYTHGRHYRHSHKILNEPKNAVHNLNNSCKKHAQLTQQYNTLRHELAQLQGKKLRRQKKIEKPRPCKCPELKSYRHSNSTFGGTRNIKGGITTLKDQRSCDMYSMVKNMERKNTTLHNKIDNLRDDIKKQREKKHQTTMPQTIQSKKNTITVAQERRQRLIQKQHKTRESATPKKSVKIQPTFISKAQKTPLQQVCSEHKQLAHKRDTLRNTLAHKKGKKARPAKTYKQPRACRSLQEGHSPIKGRHRGHDPVKSAKRIERYNKSLTRDNNYLQRKIERYQSR